MTNARGYVHPTLVGIYDPSGSLPRGTSERLGTALPAAQASVFEDSRLAVAVAPGGAERAGVLAMLAGRIYRTPGALDPSSAVRGPEHRIAAAYRRSGASVLDDVSGNFVLLLWDAEARRGIIAQDQIGGRSLYYSSRGGQLFFASDIGPLLRLLPSRPAPDDVTLLHHLANTGLPMERTVYDGVRRVCGGHLLELDDGGWRRRRYWAPRYRPRLHLSRPELQERFWETVQSAVRMRTADVDQLGIIMSGGVDSTTVAAAAVAARNGSAPPLRGYSAVFPSRAEVDETDRINQLVDGLGIDSIQIEPQPGGIVPLMLEYMRTWDVPLSGPGLILEWPLLEQAARDGTDVLLDGQGGDEVFGMSPYLLADRIRQARLLSSFRLARRFPLVLENPPLKWSRSLWKTFGLKAALPYAVDAGLRRRRSRLDHAFLEPASARVLFETDSSLDWKRNFAGPLWWRFKAFLVTEGREKTYLTDYLRHRAAMVGIEARPPLLDLDLVRFSIAYPTELDFDNRYDRPNIREALRGRAPDAVRLDRRKSSLGPFYHAGWTGADLPLVRELLIAADARVRRFVRPAAIEALLADPPACGQRGWLQFGSRVWGLLVVECFLRHQEDPAFAERLLHSSLLARPGSRVVRAPLMSAS